MLTTTTNIYIIIKVVNLRQVSGLKEGRSCRKLGLKKTRVLIVLSDVLNANVQDPESSQRFVSVSTMKNLRLSARKNPKRLENVNLNNLFGCLIVAC